MKKSTIALLAIVYGFIGIQAYALAPTFNTIPTVVISDSEDSAITVDNNWFRYINALNVLEFVNIDESLTPADLTFSFSEVTTEQEVAINDKVALDEGAGELGSNPPVANQLTAGGYWLSFQDLVRSPLAGSTPFPDPSATALPGGMLPWTAVGGAMDAESRGVVLWVVDTNDKTASTTVAVMSIDNSYDDLSGSVTTAFGGPLVVASASQDPSGDNSWFLLSNVSPTPPAGVSYGTGSSAGGSMSIQVGVPGGVKWFNRWQQTQAALATGKIPYVTGNVLYAAFFGVTHNAATRGQAPTLRIGVANGAENIQMYNAINSVDSSVYSGAGLTDAQANTQLADSGVKRYYPVYWESFENTTNWDSTHMTLAAMPEVDARTWFAFFDVINDTASATDSGTWTMSDFYVVTTPMPDFGAAEMEYTDFTAAGNWSLSTQNGASIIKTDNQPAAGMIRFADTGQSAPYWYLWTNTVDKIAWQKGKVIRLSFYLSCPTATDRENFHRFRGRLNEVLQNVTSELFVRRALSHTPFMEPGCPPVYSGNPADLTEPMRYSGYTPSYGGPSAELSAVPGGFDQFVLSFDALHNNADTEPASSSPTAYSLHKAVIDIFNDPFGLD